MKDQKKFWDKGARFYTQFMRKNQGTYLEFCRIIEPFLNEDARVLEIGCGTGQITYLLKDKVREIVATDYSEKMVEEAEKRRTAPNISFRVEDGTSLTFDDESFDCVVIGNVLHIVPDSDSIVQEVRRVLKKDGLILVITFVYGDDRDEGKDNLMLRLMGKTGFRTYRRFTQKSQVQYIEGAGFEIEADEIVRGRPLDEGVVVGRKI